MGTELSLKLISSITTAMIIGVVFYSIIIHEVSHALVARWLGDDTASRQGRLSLNPLKHIDWFGTVILPLLLFFSAGFIWGYAKPVPINPYNFKNYKRDMGISALAGPLSNILIGFFFAIIYHLANGMVLIQQFWYMIIYFNFLLAFFNLIPIPPLDGSKVLGMFLSDQAYFRWTAQERKGMMALFIIILASNRMGFNLFGRIVLPPVKMLMNLLGL